MNWRYEYEGQVIVKLSKVLVAIILITFLTACGSGTTAHIGYQPPGIPVTITIDSDGTVQAEWAGSIQTPIGNFSAGVDVNPAQMFPKANGTLTVRINGQDIVYDLAGNQGININLNSGYYKEINLQKTGNDWLFEVERTSGDDSGSAASSNSASSSIDSTPVFDHINTHEGYSNGQMVINDDVYFRDLGGDADLIEYDLQSVVPDISGVQVQNDSIDASSDQQIAGTYQTITWECGPTNKIYAVTLKAHIVDRAGNQSSPFSVVFNCH